MKLYYASGACALSPQIVLRESGLPFTLEQVTLKDHKVVKTGEDYYGINSKGAVPLLELDNGERLSEGVAIVQYIADKAPNANLAPANGTWERTRLQEMLNYITSELHKGLGLFFSGILQGEARDKWISAMTKKYAYIDEILGKTPYLMGEKFSVADAYLYNVTRLCSYDAIKLDLSSFKNLQAFMQRMNQRPSVQASLQAEGIA